jgi:ABC-type glycerol-3-phosphate transport system substrate-binding protein
LTVWIPDTFGGLDTEKEWQALEDVSSNFQAEYPNLRVRYVRKAATVSGGLIDFLNAARDVAPTVLPDLVILPTSQVYAAIHDGHLRPLGKLLSAATMQDLYGFATTEVIDGRLLALGFAVDIEHLAYDPVRVESPPATWKDVLDLGKHFIFPAAGVGGQLNDATLLQYLVAGGQLVDANGEASLDQEPLKQVFSFYAQAVREGVIATDTLQIGTSDEAWREYLKGNASFTTVTSHRFGLDGLRRGTTSFAPLPTLDGRRACLARGWSIGLVTDDTVRQDAAKQYLTWLLSPDVLGQWALKTAHLPSTRSALEVAVADEDYRAFLNTLLESAGIRPSSPAAAKASTAAQRALQDLLLQKLTPDEAVNEAVNSLR